ncbi:MAG: transcription antitermination factor NusB [Thermoleophilia bacterium]|nr:transcription antitermination factor NusB [Thermoleophilia bacterium]
MNLPSSTSRRQARRDAMVVLYQHDLTGGELEGLYENLEGREEHELEPYTREVVEGVLASQVEIDGLIDASADNWTASRMAALERNILRLAIYEIRYRDDVPAEVSIDEAVELARRFCSNEAGSLINGVLSNVADGEVKN